MSQAWRKLPSPAALAVLTAFAAAAFAAPASAQRDTGVLVVHVAGPDGSALPGVTVVARGPVGSQWSRDSSSITYREVRQAGDDGESYREQAIVRRLVGGSRRAETLFAAPFATSHSWTPASWTPDDDRLIYDVATQSPRLLVAAPDAPERDSVLFEDDSATSAYTLSHDGKWLSYVSTQFGSEAIYVRPFPAGDEFKVSLAGGTEPRWGPEDSELFYIAENQLVSARVSVADGVFSVESREVLFDLTEYPGRRGVRARYDVHPDGNRFVMIRPNSVDDTHAINVVLNWFQDIARRAGEQGQ